MIPIDIEGNYTYPRRHVIAALLLLIVVWIIATKSIPDLELLRSQTSDFIYGDTTPEPSPRDAFVEQALKNEIYTSEYNGSAVQKLCQEAQWRNDRVMSCDRMAGGIGNLRPDVLACPRYAIEAGAMLVTPVLHPRKAFEKMENSFDYDVDLPLSYLFDSDHYYRRLAEDCPQLRIINEENDPLTTGFVLPPRDQSHEINPKKLIPVRPIGDVLEDPSKWRAALDAHIETDIVQKHSLPEPSSENPIRLSFNEMIIFSWPVDYDPDDFRDNWGHIAVFPNHIRRIAARALYNLYTKIGVQTQSPSKPSTGAFLGAHLRTAADAASYSWTSYEKQSRQIRDQLEAYGLSVVYVATGNADDIDRLRNDVADMKIRINQTHTTGVQVFQKWDLVDEKDAKETLGDLTWDQMAIIDMEIMLRASRFVGIAESSWGWMVALKRHAWSDADPYDYDAHPITFEDELSILYGPKGALPIIAPCTWL